jgi:hypothetical protein
VIDRASGESVPTSVPCRLVFAICRTCIRLPRIAERAVLAGCASLAVTPCDTIADRDGKYFGRFFLGVATLGLSEVTIQQEEVRLHAGTRLYAEVMEGAATYLRAWV